jgi:CheY-like chemotaxis protein
MGGSIRIDSKKNCGTTVTIHLQFEVIEMNAAVYQDTVKTEEDYDSMIAGKTVLLAEDHPLNAQIVEHLLEKKNVKVYHAQNGKIAVEKFAASEEGFFDMVLMDIRMPEMDGYQACDKIRKMNRKDAKTIPIVAMTANAYAEDIQKSMEVGMNAHLAKPVDPQLLYETIAKLK